MTLETRLETKMEYKSLRDNRIFTNSLVVILGVTWGLAFVAIRTADFQLSPVNLTVVRWLIASAGFGCVSRNSPSIPTAMAARASGAIIARFPPLTPFWLGRCTECVAS